MDKIIALTAYAFSVLISSLYYQSHWVVGPVFGMAVLAANYPKIKNKVSTTHWKFLAASTLVYALVYWIARIDWDMPSDLSDMLAGSATAGVAAGSVLMPFLHAALFKKNSREASRVSLGLIGSWYAVNLLSMADEKLGIPGEPSYIFLAIALWQGIYMKYLKT